MELGDLNGDWRHVSVGLPADTGNMMAMYATLFSGGAGDVYFTKGDLVTLGSDQFLVADRVPAPKLDFQALQRAGGQPPSPPKLTAATVLTLALLNLHTVSSLSDIRPFDLTQEIADSAAPAPLPNWIAPAPSDTTVPPDSPSAASPLEAESVNRLRQLGVALVEYMQDHDENLPPMTNASIVKKAIFPYVKDDAVFINPVSHQPYLPNTSLSRRALPSFNAPPGMITYYEATPASDDTRAVLFLDGHVKRVPESEWPRLKAASHVPNTPVPSDLPPGAPG